MTTRNTVFPFLIFLPVMAAFLVFPEPSIKTILILGILLTVRLESLKKPHGHSKLRSRIYQWGIRGKVEPT